MDWKETVKANKLWVIIGIIAILVVVAFFASCDSGNKQADVPKPTCPAGKALTNVRGICFPELWHGGQIDRADGGFVVLEQGAPSDPETRKKIGEMIVAGIRDTITAATHHNPTWPAYRNSGEYQVGMITKTATNMDGTPALLVGNTNAQTAGTVINVFGDCRQGTAPIMVLPLPDRYDDAYWNYLYNSARNEAEHVIEYRNHCGTFLSFTGVNDSHPHWSMPNAPVGFVGKSVACAIETGEGPETKLK